MKKTRKYIGKILNRSRSATPTQDRGISPMPQDVTSLQVPESGGASLGSGSASHAPPQMFSHASHFKISESVFTTGPVSVIYGAERNTEEISKVSL